MVYDEDRVTVTTSEHTRKKLINGLKTRGAHVNEISLRGRFHCNCYSSDLTILNEFCDRNPLFQLPDFSEASVPIRLNSGDGPVTRGKLYHAVLRSLLVEKANWHQTLVQRDVKKAITHASSILSIGPERSVPPSFAKCITQEVLHISVINASDPYGDTSHDAITQSGNTDGVAIVGMSCRLPGANDILDFWKLLLDAKSQHKEVPDDRVALREHWRNTDPTRKWYGNFIDDPGVFDYKFFKKTPREANSMDPQQRIMLELAYQAAEQSGYFRQRRREINVGCFVGLCATDYENNIACHAPNAFSATGNLRSFVAGKISHYFGWTGPSITLDTACSSSAVAIHQACRAILSGECNLALAGGANIITNPLWFQNLAEASFLSRTGQCKSFDKSADGYCRGEGLAVVFLKRMADAVADGDQIIASLPSTLVYQNNNCTPIFVPNSPSLDKLFDEAVHNAQLQPQQISYVEAHGTGTPVGDPAEYESIRRIFGGPSRSRHLLMGSSKGLIGHTEGTSGVVSVIKVALMVQNQVIPPQASFTAMNPALRAKPSDKIEINTQQKPWIETFRAALINNYGASGSNVSLIVTSTTSSQQAVLLNTREAKQPFWLAALDDRGIKAYAQKLQDTLKANATKFEERVTLADLSYNLARQSNRALPQSQTFSCSSIDELQHRLSATMSGTEPSAKRTVDKTRPVVLCFGGQISTSIGLDRHLYDIQVFRKHLDHCDKICRTYGFPSIYPAIFQTTTIEDPVSLQLMLFSMQYSCAETWIECGIEPSAIIGHSFGELTCLCVSGVLTLEDTIQIVARRAAVIRDHWKTERGSMLAIEGEREEVQALMAEVNQYAPEEHHVTVACYNSDTSFTLAGPSRAIDAIHDVSSMKMKRLNVPYAFHSTLVEPLLEHLIHSADGITFHAPKLHFEVASDIPYTSLFSASFIASHMRKPVYFSHAVQRLSKLHPSAVWLEAGSNSTVTSMAKKALSKVAHTAQFQSINITSTNGLSQLSDATVSLWRGGVDVDFWPHHRSQAPDYKLVLLPPYQFEKNRHWLELKDSPPVSTETTQAVRKEESEGLLAFVEYLHNSTSSARYRINTASNDYQLLISGHTIARTAAICPGTLQVDMAFEAARNLRPELKEPKYLPQLKGMENSSAICVDPSRTVSIYLEARTLSDRSWNWKILSESDTTRGEAPTLHANGSIEFYTEDDEAYRIEFGKLERLVSHKNCLRLLESDAKDVEIMQGRNIYRSFADCVDYGDIFRGVDRLVGKEDTSAGHVSMPYSGKSWLDTPVSDCFCQVAGIFVNCMTSLPDSDMFVASGADQWIRTPRWNTFGCTLTNFDVYATHHRASDKLWISDVFVFDPTSGQLTEAIMGIRFFRMAKQFMARILQKLTPSLSSHAAGTSASTPERESFSPERTSARVGLVQEARKSTSKDNSPSGDDVRSRVKSLLADLTGLQPHEVEDSTELVDIGLDSLMGMEMAREIEKKFSCSFDMHQLAEIVNIESLVDYVCSVLGVQRSTAGASTSPKNGGADQANLTSKSGVVDQIPDSSLLDVHPLAYTNGISNGIKPIQDDLALDRQTILDAFQDCKDKTDDYISQYGCAEYMDTVLPEVTQLCIALVLEAFDHLGYPIAGARKGAKLQRISSVSELQALTEYLYRMLEQTGRLIDIQNGEVVRTSVTAPSKSASELKDDLLRHYPGHAEATKLTFFTGSKLAGILTGEIDGIKLIFGTPEGKDLASALYAESKLNLLSIRQMAAIVRHTLVNVDTGKGPLRILEVGAGTGGFTSGILETLAEAQVTIEYLFTDLSSSMVASARNRFRNYPFMKFRALNIEKDAPADLLDNHHIIIAHNCVHATHSIEHSARMLHSMLRSDGFLMLMEMTSPLHWVDLVFGIFEGWWLFDDGRKHAIAHQDVWETALHSAGYGHVDWTDGHRPEANIQRVIVAHASGPQEKRRRPARSSGSYSSSVLNHDFRKKTIDMCVERYRRGFAPLLGSRQMESLEPFGHCVLVTGATGSLGAHVVAHLAGLPHVSQIMCINRKTTKDANQRQLQSLEEKGIALSLTAKRKLRIFEASTHKKHLGLSQEEYDEITSRATAVIHNAWPMNGRRGLKGFEFALQTTRNLIDLAADIARQQTWQGGVVFQFISSIAAVGHYPLRGKGAKVPEQQVEVSDVLPNGYGEAKYACERLLDKTLGQYPEHFRPMSVRLGQIAGSRSSGYWNSNEFIAMLFKSSQTLKAFPRLGGELSWTPVDVVAATLGDLVFSKEAQDPVYHIDNPVRQDWKEATAIIMDELGIAVENVVDLDEWATCVRRFPGSAEIDNPALKLIDLLEKEFVSMSCGGVLLDTAKTCKRSPTLGRQGPVSEEVMRRYFDAWRKAGFL